MKFEEEDESLIESPNAKRRLPPPVNNLVLSLNKCKVIKQTKSKSSIFTRERTVSVRGRRLESTISVVVKPLKCIKRASSLGDCRKREGKKLITEDSLSDGAFPRFMLEPLLEFNSVRFKGNQIQSQK